MLDLNLQQSPDTPLHGRPNPASLASHGRLRLVDLPADVLRRITLQLLAEDASFRMTGSLAIDADIGLNMLALRCSCKLWRFVNDSLRGWHVDVQIAVTVIK
ncbi:hypothetical protein GGF32_001416 [Allomyces javanicus]|nr:hypothetical protein GGF32_001416 [Allomyces javanicus]